MNQTSKWSHSGPSPSGSCRPLRRERRARSSTPCPAAPRDDETPTLASPHRAAPFAAAPSPSLETTDAPQGDVARHEEAGTRARLSLQAARTRVRALRSAESEPQ
jgi:hypothetical protein